jgi:hypothetical protein
MCWKPVELVARRLVRRNEVLLCKVIEALLNFHGRLSRSLA